MLADRSLPDRLAAMAAPASTMDILTRFRLKDFNVSIDDVGTGHSSLVQPRVAGGQVRCTPRCRS